MQIKIYQFANMSCEQIENACELLQISPVEIVQFAYRSADDVYSLLRQNILWENRKGESILDKEEKEFLQLTVDMCKFVINTLKKYEPKGIRRISKAEIRRKLKEAITRE